MQFHFVRKQMAILIFKVYNRTLFLCLEVVFMNVPLYFLLSCYHMYVIFLLGAYWVNYFDITCYWIEEEVLAELLPSSLYNNIKIFGLYHMLIWPSENIRLFLSVFCVFYYIFSYCTFLQLDFIIYVDSFQNKCFSCILIESFWLYHKATLHGQEIFWINFNHWLVEIFKLINQDFGIATA